MKLKYKLKIEPEAKDDIQDNIKWYNEQQKSLGKRFYKEVKDFLNSLETNPFYAIKYDNIRCLPLKKFPYTIHFSVNEDDNIIIVRAVFQTSRKPKHVTKEKNDQ